MVRVSDSFGYIVNLYQISEFCKALVKKLKQNKRVTVTGSRFRIHGESISRKMYYIRITLAGFFTCDIEFSGKLNEIFSLVFVSILAYLVRKSCYS